MLAAAKAFARENFGAQHRYLMALHTHQQHPHVHLLVKAEREDGDGRLHIDKAMLREWRQDFARRMREQGIAANATSRAARGETRRGERDAIYRAKARGRSSYALQEEMRSIVRELSATGTIRDPAHAKLAETRRAILAGWMNVASTLEAQGEHLLAGEVRSFARTLPPAWTDRERLAARFIRHVKARRSEQALPARVPTVREIERTR